MTIDRDTPDRIWTDFNNERFSAWTKDESVARKLKINHEYIKASKVNALVQALEFEREELSYRLMAYETGPEFGKKYINRLRDRLSVIDNALNEYKGTK